MSMEKFFEVRGLLCRIFTSLEPEMTCNIAHGIYILLEISFGMEAAIFEATEAYLYMSRD